MLILKDILPALIASGSGSQSESPRSSGQVMVPGGPLSLMSVRKNRAIKDHRIQKGWFLPKPSEDLDLALTTSFPTERPTAKRLLTGSRDLGFEVGRELAAGSDHP